MHTVYVVGALIPNGGTRVAYRLGEIASDILGLSLVAVTVDGESMSDRFNYRTQLGVVSLDHMRSRIEEGDLLICNPSFSHLRLGALTGPKKLMYVQGFNTFADIDRGFDCYVAVSSFVRELLSVLHDIEMPCIPAYVETHDSLRHQTRSGVLVFVKPGTVMDYSLDALLTALAPHGCTLWAGGSHAALRDAMSAASVFVYLGFPEGFGLPPLEAMAQGAIVISTDTRGGRDFLRHGENSLVIPRGDIMKAVAMVDSLTEASWADAMREAARRTAMQYSLAEFQRRWTPVLEAVMSGSWHQADARTWTA